MRDKNGKRLLKRIIAIMLIFALVIPQMVNSDVASAAIGDDITVTMTSIDGNDTDGYQVKAVVATKNESVTISDWGQYSIQFFIGENAITDIQSVQEGTNEVSVKNDAVIKTTDKIVAKVTKGEESVTSAEMDANVEYNVPVTLTVSNVQISGNVVSATISGESDLSKLAGYKIKTSIDGTDIDQKSINNTSDLNYSYTFSTLVEANKTIKIVVVDGANTEVASGEVTTTESINANSAITIENLTISAANPQLKATVKVDPASVVSDIENDKNNYSVVFTVNGNTITTVAGSSLTWAANLDVTASVPADKSIKKGDTVVAGVVYSGSTVSSTSKNSDCNIHVTPGISKVSINEDASKTKDITVDIDNDYNGKLKYTYKLYTGNPATEALSGSTELLDTQGKNQFTISTGTLTDDISLCDYYVTVLAENEEGITSGTAVESNKVQNVFTLSVNAPEAKVSVDGVSVENTDSGSITVYRNKTRNIEVTTTSTTDPLLTDIKINGSSVSNLRGQLIDDGENLKTAWKSTINAENGTISVTAGPAEVATARLDLKASEFYPGYMYSVTSVVEMIPKKASIPDDFDYKALPTGFSWVEGKKNGANATSVFLISEDYTVSDDKQNNGFSLGATITGATISDVSGEVSQVSKSNVEVVLFDQAGKEVNVIDNYVGVLVKARFDLDGTNYNRYYDGVSKTWRDIAASERYVFTDCISATTSYTFAIKGYEKYAVTDGNDDYYDTDGTMTEYTSVEIKVDTTNPTLDAAETDENGNTTGLIPDENAADARYITIDASEIANDSGLGKIFITNTAVTTSEKVLNDSTYNEFTDAVVVEKVESFADLRSHKLTHKFTEKADGNHTYYIYVFDRVGHYSVKNVYVGCISKIELLPYEGTAVDNYNKNEKKELTLNKWSDLILPGQFDSDNAKYYTKGGVNLPLSVQGVLTPDTVTKTYSISKDGTPVAASKLSGLYELTIKNPCDYSKDDQIYTYTFKAPAQDTDDGEYVINLKAKDDTGAVDESVDVIVDNTDPKLSVSVADEDGKVISSGSNDKYTALESTKQKTISLEVDDTNYSEFYYSKKKLDVVTVENVRSLGDDHALNQNDQIVLSDENYQDDTYYFYTFDKAGNITEASLTVGPIINPDVINFGQPDADHDTYKKNAPFSGKNAVFTGEVSSKVKAEVVFEQGGKEKKRIVAKKESETQKNDKATIEYGFSIPNNLADGKYNVYLEVKDGRYVVSGKNDAVTIVIDNTFPVVTHSELLDNEYVNLELVGSKNTKVKWGLNIVDDNLKLVKTKTLSIKRSGTDEEQEKTLKDNLNYEYTSKTDVTGFWNRNEKGASVSATLPVEAEYYVVFVVTDKAGNSTTHKMSFTYDVTVPAMTEYSVEPVSKTGSANANYKDYQVFDNSKLLINMSFSDDVSGINSVAVSGTHNSDNPVEDLAKNYSYKDLKTKVSDVNYTIDTNFKGKVKLTLKDKAGNETTVTRKYDGTKGNSGLIREDGSLHKTTSSIDFKTDVQNARVIEGTEYYKNGVNIGFTIKDEISGIRKVLIRDNGKNVTRDGYTKKDTITRKASEAYQIKKEENGPHIISALLTDNAGNTLESRKQTVVVDSVKPQIDIRFDTNNASTYYNTTRTATITITDKNYYATDTKITITKNGDVIGVVPNFSGSGDVKTMQYAFDQDGDYTLRVETTDKAGNKAEPKEEPKFTIDKTQPKLNLTFNNNDFNDVGGQRYFKASRIGTLTVNEHNFDPSNTVITVNNSSQNVSWSNSGDVHTASISFTEDSDYTISVTSTDLAGNKEESAVSESFTIDTTPPEVSFEGVVNGEVYTDRIAPKVTISDTNYDSNNSVLTLKSSKSEKADKRQGSGTSGSSEVFSYDDFGRDAKNDGFYTLAVTAVDKAGNSAVIDKSSVNFIVDRYGSDFVLGSYAKSVNDSGNLKELTENLVIEEHSWVGVEAKNRKVYFTVGDDIYELEENNGYTIDEKKNGEEYVYTYTIDKDQFTRDGQYSVTISTTDAKGKISDNELKGAKLGFFIDTVDPDITIGNIQDGQKYEDVESITATFDLHDNVGIKSAKVTIDDVETQYSEEDLKGMNNQIMASFDKGDHTVTITVMDSSGREKTETISFTVGKNSNWLLWVGIGLGVLLILGIIIVVVRKRRQK